MLALPPITTPAIPLSAVEVWSVAGSAPKLPPVDAVADPICHSVPSVQPWLLSAKSSLKSVTEGRFCTPVIGSQRSRVQASLSFGSTGVLLTPVVGSQLSTVQASLSFGSTAT